MDFVVVGSGAAGGVVARELAVPGFDVVVLEQRPYLRAHQFRHDELGYVLSQELMGPMDTHPQTFRRSESEEASILPFRWWIRSTGPMTCATSSSATAAAS